MNVIHVRPKKNPNSMRSTETKYNSNDREVKWLVQFSMLDVLSKETEEAEDFSALLSFSFINIFIVT